MVNLNYVPHEKEIHHNLFRSLGIWLSYVQFFYLQSKHNNQIKLIKSTQEER